ncbi:radical SAM protein [Candidatus Woesearchaeota archaeon]|jgi:uncharacterized protein|nr:radical SAM protein [Candidatus Woesearchaeota archaeon]
MELDVTLVAQATEKCNLDCDYCYLAKKRLKRDMNIDVAELLIKSFIEHNNQFAHFTWAGGEPLLRKNDFWQDIINIGEHYNKKGLELSHSIQTNGLLLTKNRHKELTDMGFKIGSSFDGCLELQDLNRKSKGGKDVGQSILENIVALEGDTGLISVLTKDMVGKEEEVYKNLRELSQKARVNFFVPSGEGLENSEDLLPGKEESYLSMKKFYELWKNDESDFILNPFSSMVRGLFLGWVKTCDFSSYACYRILGANPVGELFLCSRSANIPETIIGNITETGLQEIVGSERHQIILDRFVNLEKGECDGCDYLPYCSGGCPIEALSYSGNFMDKTYYCETRKGLFDLILGDLNTENGRSRLQEKVGMLE